MVGKCLTTELPTQKQPCSVIASLFNSGLLTGGTIGSVSGCLAGGDVFLAISLRRGKNRTENGMRSWCEGGILFSL